MIEIERSRRQAQGSNAVLFVKRTHRIIGSAERHHRRRSKKCCIGMTSGGGTVDERGAGASVAERFAPPRTRWLRRLAALRAICERDHIGVLRCELLCVREG